jgi:4-hydroxy-3-methylbut-2-enyl diphosphate reductase
MQLWSDLETGKRYTGTVKSMTSYGVFVDIGGVDGMIHVSELSWKRVRQPSEVVAIGDEIVVSVKDFDKEKRKISLTCKRPEDNPWANFASKHAVGDIISVKIVKMMPFGAFAEICPGVDGLIHISQITDHRIDQPSEVLSDGQVVDVKITEIDSAKEKVSLSIRALMDPSSQPVTDKEAAEAAQADKTPVVVYDTDAPPEDSQLPLQDVGDAD